MNKQTYLAKLAQLLAPLPEQERQDALNYYEEYFDAAGPEAEDATAAELGDPADAARKAAEACADPVRKPQQGRAATLPTPRRMLPPNQLEKIPQLPSLSSTARPPSRRLWACCWLLPPCWSWSASY